VSALVHLCTQTGRNVVRYVHTGRYGQQLQQPQVDRRLQDQPLYFCTAADRNSTGMSKHEAQLITQRCLM
jgi:hypothetical protein